MPPARPKPIQFLGFTCYCVRPGHWQSEDDLVRVAIYLDDSWVGSPAEYKVYITLFGKNTANKFHTFDWAGPKLEDIETHAKEYLQMFQDRLTWLQAKKR